MRKKLIKNVPYILRDYNNLIIVNPEPNWNKIQIDGITFSRDIFKYFSDIKSEGTYFQFIKLEDGIVTVKTIERIENDDEIENEKKRSKLWSEALWYAANKPQPHECIKNPKLIDEFSKKYKKIFAKTERKIVIND